MGAACFYLPTGRPWLLAGDHREIGAGGWAGAVHVQPHHPVTPPQCVARMDCQMITLNPVTEITSPAKLTQSPTIIFPGS